MIVRLFAILMLLGVWSTPARGAAAPPPQKVVSLAPSVTETVFALGLGGRLVGVTNHCDYPPEARRIANIGGFMNPSVEAILAKRPELVIGVSGATDPAKARELERFGLRVILLSLSSVREILKTMRDVGAVLGNTAAGEKLAAKIAASLDRVHLQVAGAPTRSTLLVVGLSPLVTVGGSNYIDELITLAGGKNIAGDAAQPWLNLPDEFVIAKGPEVIIEAGMGSERGSRGKNWADLRSIPAVREGRVHSYASDKILRPGPRIGEALEEIARLVHPECFERSGRAAEGITACERPRP
jgi:iron complex transport system substrate-binding protein